MKQKEKIKYFIPWIFAAALAVIMNWLGNIYANVVYPVFAFPAAKCAGIFFNAAPVFNEKGIITIPIAGSPVTITHDCSAYGFFCIIAAMLVIFSAKIKFGKIIAILFTAYIITVVANTFRIISSYKIYVLTAGVVSEIMQNIIHLSVGVTTFLNVMLILYLRLKKIEVGDDK